MFQELNRPMPAALDYSVATWAERIALREDADAITYSELGARIDRAAHALATSGVRRGDHVAYLMGVGQDWVEVFFAVLKLGGVVVPLNLTWTSDELITGLALTDASFLVVGSDHRGNSLLDIVEQARGKDAGPSGSPVPNVPGLRQVITVGDRRGRYAWTVPLRSGEGVVAYPALHADDRAMLLLSSGSTSFPKPVIHSHRSLLTGIVSYADGLEISSADTFVHTTPSYHVGGIVTMVGPLLRGGTVRLTDWFEPERTMRLIEADRATLLWGFETHYAAMQQDPSYGNYDLSSISRTMVAANPAAAQKVKAMGFAHVGSLYGSTEYVGSQSFFPFRDRFDSERMITSHGRPLTGEIKIVNPETRALASALEAGEICVRGPALFAGYYNMPEETAACIDSDGFFHSGDMGYVDADGYVYYRGRYKEVIKSGGENVSAAEVEQFLVSSVPGARRVVVVGVPDERWGEAVVAVIEGDDQLDPEQVRDMCRDKLAGYKIPKRIVFVDGTDWRITPTGKLDRGHVRDLALSALGLRADV